MLESVALSPRMAVLLVYFEIMWVCVGGYMGWLSTSDTAIDIFQKAAYGKNLLLIGGIGVKAVFSTN